MKKLILTGLVLVAAAASARTLALWPLNWNEQGGAIDGRCAINSANNLSGDSSLACDWAAATALGWELPPNPDTTGSYVFEPRLASVVYSLGSAAAKNYAYTTADAVGRAVKGDREFTLETYIRVPEIPASGKLFFIADCDGLTSGNRWFFTLRNNSGPYTGVSWQLFSEAHGIGDTVLAALSDSRVAELTRGWHHLALTLRQEATNVVWTLYQDGEKFGSLIGRKAGTINATRYFGLGGRNNAGNVFKGALAYCRLSDEVLPPERFLCGARDSQTKTLEFWKMAASSADAVDLSPAGGGNVHLTGGFLSWYSQYSDSLLFPDDDCAFTGNPPNTTVTLPDGNRGCLYSRVQSARSTMRINNLGSKLTLTNDFTVEGWVRPENRDDRLPYAGTHQLCETRVATSVGWVFQTKGLRGQLKLVVFAQDANGYLTAGGDAVIGDLAAYEDNWVHVALSYRHDEGPNGRGVWRGYINGVLSGCVTNTAAPAAATAYESYFKFGLRGSINGVDPTLAGKLDCWRVSGAALAPAQLLCTSQGCEAATNVLALWPMNVINGIYIDGTDVVGSYTFETPRPADRRARACADGPVVPGLSTATSGSVGFRVDDTTSRAMVLCNDTLTVKALVATNGSTYEVYFKRTSAPTSANEFLFIGYPGSYNSADFGKIDQRTLGTPVALCSNFTYSDTGFHLFMRGLTVNGSAADQTFKDSVTGQNITVPVNTWVHLALTQKKTGTSTVFDLYLDGVKRSTITYNGGTVVTPDVLYIGGRPNSENSFRGQMALLRISQGVRATNDFLCARSATPASVAYWPLDNAPTLDLASAIRSDDGRHDFTTSSVLSGSAERARAAVPRPDATAGFIGTPAANVGSVVLGAAGYAHTPRIGGEVALDAPFTVEGWVKWANTAGAAREVIAGTYNAGGWKLVLDSTGETPALRLFAHASSRQSILADGVLLADASALRGAWTHLALAYDPGVGYGTWTLRVDGREVGSVANRWQPAAAFPQSAFRLGAFAGDVSFQGGYDMWRVSRGIRGEDDLLWRLPGGTLITVR